MGKVWISLLLLCVAVANAALPAYDSNEAQDFYDNSYDSILDILDKVGSEEVLDDRKNEEPYAYISDENFEKYDDDYQIEDNRSDLVEENNDKPEDSNGHQDSNEAAESSFEEDLKPMEVVNEENILKPEQIKSTENDDQNDNLSDSESNNKLSEEITFGVDHDIESLPLPPKGEIDEEIKRVISETESKFKVDGGFEDRKQLQNVDEEEIADEDFADLDEDSVDMAYKDLNEDLAKLMETWKKLAQDDVAEEKDADDSIRPDEISEYEEKYDRPYKEGVVLSQRDEIYENDENNVEKKLDDDVNNSSKEKQLDAKIPATPAVENAEDSDVILGKEENDVDDMVSAEDNDKDVEDEIEDVNDDNDEDDDKENDNIALEESISIEDDIDEDLSPKISDDIKDDYSKDMPNNNEDIVDPIPKISINEPLIDESNSTSNSYDKSGASKVEDEQEEEKIDGNFENAPRMYFVDSLLANEDDNEREKTTTTQTEQDFKTMDLKELSPDQYNQIMEQFKMLHKEELDVYSETFEDDVAVIHVPISLDNPVVIESPNYPNPYPINNIIDWMFEGDGVGIELNVTDLAVNGVGGDYLLVKPGGIDESGTDGLVFSYHLNEPRRYRFLDVDRMFVRFVAMPGWSFPSLRGFQISVKMVAPLPRMEEEPLPEPEPELPEPVETLTLILGGIPAVQFHRIQEQFRVLLADMATMYINANGIDPGLNTTLEVTQITSVKLCNINWPNFENCTDITFAVPLVYEEDEENDEPRLNSEELNAMWNQYSRIDPFAARLRRLGVTEFASPNDSSILAVWIVISVGVLIIMAIMAVALWKYSCFDTYTRMPEFSSRDSLYNEKQGLDLYPTPHQTLPPLYESDLNWADGKFEDSARVDMSCYTNRNFTRDELSDIDSDEDVISTRDRKIVIMAPKDGYEA